MVDIWSIFGFFFWWSIFDKTPVAGLYIVNSKTMPDITVQVYSVAVKSYETNYTFYNSNIKLDKLELCSQKHKMMMHFKGKS